ncbi:hypothetical protein GCM10010303_12300 [Streptomyces purpurascens]|nr:hypothetical protein GCM10010303_12300 [Streptomyces purpurascens]
MFDVRKRECGSVFPPGWEFGHRRTFFAASCPALDPVGEVPRPAFEQGGGTPDMVRGCGLCGGLVKSKDSLFGITRTASGFCVEIPDQPRPRVVARLNAEYVSAVLEPSTVRVN